MKLPTKIILELSDCYCKMARIPVSEILLESSPRLILHRSSERISGFKSSSDHIHPQRLKSSVRGDVVP